jgi:hypothetical protein
LNEDLSGHPILLHSIWTITTFQYNPKPHLCICPILERILKNLLW